FVDLQEKSAKTLKSKPIHSLKKSFATSCRFWIEGFGVVVRRRTLVKKSKLATPWEKLIHFPSEHGCERDTMLSISTIRAKLLEIFKSERSVELIIMWCRVHT